MGRKFKYGQDIDGYIQEAMKRIRVCHPWATEGMMRPECSYAIEKEGRKKVFAAYFRWSDGTTDRSVFEDSEEFVEKIVSDNVWWIEGENPIKETYELPIPCGVDLSSWTLERYEFRKHELGGISSMIQAGNRYTGGNREFFLPDSFFEGTFEEFWDKYNDMVPWTFRLREEYLGGSDGLKEFLGFKE